MRLWTGVLALTILVSGCSNEVVYHPHPDIPNNQTQPSKPATSAADSAVKAPVVEKVGDVDVASYGIPIYPNATIQPDTALTLTDKKNGGKQIAIALDSFDDVKAIVQWYRAQLRDSVGFASGELGNAEGTSATGHHMRVSVGRLEDKSVINITADDLPKK